jgi:sugar phosphate isomerase/epimerase
VFDIHLKDKIVEKVGGREKILDVKIGTGQANYPSLFNVLSRTKWKGVLAIETDNDSFAKEPSEYVDAAIKFVTENQP